MKKTGIIVEYNPLHNGHIYHLNQAKNITKPDLVIAVISGFFCQRGCISIVDKKTKITQALKHGVDLVIELPPYYVLSSADIFAQGAIKLLQLCTVDDIVFGSETNNLTHLKEIADFNLKVDNLKEIMKKGNSYAHSYSLLNGSFEANDILAIAYLKELKNSSIIPHSILRTNSYHSLQLSEIASASAIRNAVKNKLDYHLATPLVIDKPEFNDKYFNYLKTFLLTSKPKTLSNFYLMSEGIENHLIKTISQAQNYEDFINKAICKRYTRSRIERSIIHIMMQNTKKDIQALEKLNFIRVVGFNNKAKPLLKELKKKIKIATRYQDIPINHRKMFYKAALIYGYGTDNKRQQEIIDQELSKPIII